MLRREDASRVVLKLSDEALIVREKLGLNRRILRSNIESLCVLSPSYKGTRLPTYSVVARLFSTGTQAVVGDMTDVRAAVWLVRTLATELNVEAKTRPT
jgi:hypothetical protein